MVLSSPVSKSTWSHWIIFSIMLLASALFLVSGLKRGWVPHDEGILAQSADHVLHGQLPHLDYTEIYTGGLSYLNALAFKLFGTNLASMRYMLLLFCLAWVASFYYAVSHFVSAPVAGAVTLLAVAWSVPNYSAAMPSWYNLFFATFGIASLLRYIDVKKRRWLFVAGACGGISILFKVSGLYYVAGALLFFLFEESGIPRKERDNSKARLWPKIFLWAVVLSYEVIVLLLLRRVFSQANLTYFWIPNLAIGAVMLWTKVDSWQGTNLRVVFLFRELTLFVAGITFPIALFLVPFVHAGVVSELLRGIFSSVDQHIVFVSYKASLVKLTVGTIIDGLLVLTAFSSRAIRKIAGGLCTLAAPIGIWMTYTYPYADRAAWGMMWSALPVVVVIGAGFLVLRQQPILRRQKLFLVLSVTAACSLIQFPFTIPIYYCFVAPFGILSATAIISHVTEPPRWALVGMSCFCFAYMVWIVRPGFIANMAQEFRPDREIVALAEPRAGGLRVTQEEATTYESLNRLIRAHSKSQNIYAGPECPEVYFLNGLQDLVAKLPDPNEAPVSGTQRVLDLIHGHAINLVVINGDAQFSGPVHPDLKAAIEREFLNGTQVGQFEVRWKE